MKKQIHFKIVALIVLTLFTAASFAQSTISGNVKDQDGNLIPGVNILLKETSQGANTDFDGNYEIKNVANGTYTIIASYIGYDNFMLVNNFSMALTNTPKADNRK